MTGTQITELREQLGWSMSRLAQELKVSADLVVDWEEEARFPTKKHSLALQSLRSRVS